MNLIPLSAIAASGHEAPAGAHMVIVAALILVGLTVWAMRRRSR